MGVGFFLGILDLGKALPTPGEGSTSRFLPLRCPAPAAQDQVRAANPGAAFRGCAPRGPVSAEGPVAVSVDPRPTRPGLGSARREPKGCPAGAERAERAVRQPGIPSLSPNQPVPPARAAQPRVHQSPAPAPAGESAAAAAVLPAAWRSGPGRDWRPGEGRGRGSLAPHPGCGPFHTPTRLRPYCLADNQWGQASAADDAEIRHGSAAHCPGGGVRCGLQGALYRPEARRWTQQGRGLCRCVVSSSRPGAARPPPLR